MISSVQEASWAIPKEVQAATKKKEEEAQKKKKKEPEPSELKGGKGQAKISFSLAPALATGEAELCTQFFLSWILYCSVLNNGACISGGREVRPGSPLVWSLFPYTVDVPYRALNCTVLCCAVLLPLFSGGREAKSGSVLGAGTSFSLQPGKKKAPESDKEGGGEASGTGKGKTGDGTGDKGEDGGKEGEEGEERDEKGKEEEEEAARERERKKEEAARQFREMLIEKGIAPFSKWDKELPKILFDPRYKVCAALLESMYSTVQNCSVQ